jgi:hypothetical protein
MREGFSRGSRTMLGMGKSAALGIASREWWQRMMDRMGAVIVQGCRLSSWPAPSATRVVFAAPLAPFHALDPLSLG